VHQDGSKRSNGAAGQSARWSIRLRWHLPFGLPSAEVDVMDAGRDCQVEQEAGHTRDVPRWLHRGAGEVERRKSGVSQAFIETCGANAAKGLELFWRAERLGPRDPRGWLVFDGVAAAHCFEDQFDEAVTWARKALIQNPCYSLALRVLAASLARQGEVGEAAAALREKLDIEPGLTPATRARLMFMDEGCCSRYAQGLRAAGLPE
jgi:tetratricopeptide (TPR) repeat protein